jgi:hypothetical protein
MCPKLYRPCFLGIEMTALDENAKTRFPGVESFDAEEV